MTDTNENQQPADSGLDAASCSASYDLLNAYEIHSVRWEDDDHTKGKDWRTIIVCKDMDAVWKWLESDRLDTRTEIRTIHMLGHVCQVIPYVPNSKLSQPNRE